MKTHHVSISNRKHKDKSKLLGIIIICCLLLISFVVFKIVTKDESDTVIKSSDNNVVAKNDKLKEEVAKTKIYFVAITDFINTRENINKDELKTIKFISLSKYQNILPEGLQYSYSETEQELAALISKGEIALVLPEDSRSYYKSLSVEGNNYWSKSFDPNTYLLFREFDSASDELNKIKTNSGVSKMELFVTGELIPVRGVDRLDLNANNNYTYLFDYFKSDFEQADVSIGLLENPLLGDPTPCKGCMSFVGDERAMKGFADVGYDIISTGGNHAGNAGQEGYKKTIELLKTNKIEFSGTGSSSDSKPNVAIKEVNGQRIGLYGADEVAYFYALEENSNQKEAKYGLYSFTKKSSSGLLEIDPKKVAKIKEIKESEKIDFMIIYMSWGIEYTNKANTLQTKLARELIDNGADLVVGSHPHWVQNIEFYKGKPIIYALGNFIFDQTHTLPTRQAINAKITISENEVKSITLMPHQTCGYHQTSNDLTNKYINKEITLDEIYDTEEKNGCVYWQPKKLKPNHPSYQEILNRVYQYSSFEPNLETDQL